MGEHKTCLLCGGDRTTIQKNRGDGNYENWYNYGKVGGAGGGGGGDVICSTCYQRKKREPKEDRSCSTCGSHVSRISSRGTMLWYFRNCQRVCYRCALDDTTRRRQKRNDAGRCDSETCKQARETMNVSYDYTTKAYCSRCETQHPIELPRCPCCNYKMRKRPVHLSAKKNRKLLGISPLTYH